MKERVNNRLCFGRQSFAIVAGWCTVVMLSIAHLPLFAQERDACLWLSAAGQVKLNPKWSLVLSEELRLHENFSEVGTVITDAGVEYALSPSWRFSANYRFAQRRRLDRTWSTRHRGYFDIRYRHRFARTELIARARFQQQYADMFSSAEGFMPENYLRSEFTLRYRLSPAFRPGASIEVFQPLSGRYWPEPDNIRLTINLRYEISGAHSLDIFWMMQQEFNVKRAETDYVIGLGYIFVPRNLW
jgi:hypothetical protein